MESIVDNELRRRLDSAGISYAALQHDVIVGRGYAARLAIQTAATNEQLGCAVASPLALVLLKLEAGSASDLYDVLALIERRRAIDAAPWVASIAEHLPRLSPEARAAWGRMQTLTQ